MSVKNLKTKLSCHKRQSLWREVEIYGIAKAAVKARIPVSWGKDEQTQGRNCFSETYGNDQTFFNLSGTGGERIRILLTNYVGKL